MAQYVGISKEDQWTVGETYRFKYRIDHVKLFGINVPDALVPDSIRSSLTRKQISAALDKMSQDHRFRVVGYTADSSQLTIEAVATGNASPVVIIVVAIAAVLAIFGIALSLDKVEKVVQAGNVELDFGLGDPNKPDFKLPLIPLAVTGIAAVLLWRR